MKTYRVEYYYEAPRVTQNRKWFEVRAPDRTQARRNAWMELAASHPTATEIRIESIELTQPTDR